MFASLREQDCNVFCKFSVSSTHLFMLDLHTELTGGFKSTHQLSLTHSVVFVSLCLYVLNVGHLGNW